MSLASQGQKEKGEATRALAEKEEEAGRVAVAAAPVVVRWEVARGAPKFSAAPAGGCF